jgi:RNA polymerase sigma-70 factor, ECF subfamily
VFDGLDAPRAARVLGISPVAYRLRLSRARKALRAHTKALPEPATDAATTVATRRSTA